ncbi:MAG: hypothetical protein ACRER0_02090 [Gammaproteobacteria bacterium]
MNIENFSIRKTVRLGGVMLLTLAAVLMADSSLAATPGDAYQSMDNGMSMQTNRFGGPVYAGAPALNVTVALVIAGDGPEHFSLVTALNHMLGAATVNAEVGKLTKQYGKKRVGEWVSGIDFAVNDTLRIVQEKHIKLPAPAQLSGVELAKTLVGAGTASDNTFWSGLLFDHALSHGIHMQVMDDTDAKHGAAYDANYHAITNQAFYDVAQALGDKKVKLASFH